MDPGSKKNLPERIRKGDTIRMTRFLRLFSGAILLALLSTVGMVCAANADLNVSKMVISTGPYEPGDNVTWVVTLWNNGPSDATNITLKEDITRLSGHKNMTFEADTGEYNSTTHTWNIPELKNATFTSLTLVTDFSTSGEKINRVNITALDQTDPNRDDNHAEKNVIINAAAPVTEDKPLSVKLFIKPTTLNLKSRGIFTVFVSLDGISDNDNAKSRIDYASSSLTCGEADLIRASVSDKDGGTLIAKFHRYDLENVTPGEGVKINCSGTLAVNGEEIAIEGSDTIRVIGEKKGLDKVLSQLWKFLGIEKDDIEINESEDGNVTLTITLNPDSYKNKGQAKKIAKNSDDESGKNTDSFQHVSEKNRGPKEDTGKNTGNEKILRENNGNSANGKGNKNMDDPDDESPGKSNGKKNK
jgi:hypothetical protein